MMAFRITAMLTGLVLSSASGIANEVSVTMAGMSYKPAVITANVGDRLAFTNDDSSDHNVFVATVGHAIDLGKQEPGETRTLTLGKAGKFEIECAIHPEMKAIVEVGQ
jgi:plastocyanin